MDVQEQVISSVDVCNVCIDREYTLMLHRPEKQIKKKE